MPNSRDAYFLINSFALTDADTAEAFYPGAVDAGISLIQGISVLGELMEMATESEAWTEEKGKEHMFAIGCFLKNLGRITEGINHAEANLEYALRARREKKQ
ncbi:hypothetical protein [Serratia odorifera]|uniref:hypothetical protein n=1 Tax=Serratia odorifera TaxID=618 RepID=UPI0018E75076|nr:hypothetical protein [Serratia odorifera]MBJ2066730.1 hypothetical protein [Serratia odorifera]